MAHPKRRISKTRGRKRRTHIGTSPLALSSCSNCSAMIMRHRVCPECGYYRGKAAIEKDIAL